MNSEQHLLISADSHVMEDPDFWLTHLPKELQDQAPQFPAWQVGVGFQAHPGGHDPCERVKEMATDGVSGEVLYPTLGLNLFHLQDAVLQEACFRCYNDWLVEYCSVAPERLIGIAMISLYNVERAVAELQRCRKLGLRGAIIWQLPPQELPLKSEHYFPFWAAAQDLEMPVSLHVLTGFGRHLQRHAFPGVERHRSSVLVKMQEAANAIFDLIFYGVLERFPRLKIVTVENEIAWIPYVFEQLDRYIVKGGRQDWSLPLKPSDYLYRQVYATFFNDSVGARLLPVWGLDNFMWSNDYPHPNSTWPHSQTAVQRMVGHLSSEEWAQVTWRNVVQLYKMKSPQ